MTGQQQPNPAEGGTTPHTAALPMQLSGLMWLLIGALSTQEHDDIDNESFIEYVSLFMVSISLRLGMYLYEHHHQHIYETVQHQIDAQYNSNRVWNKKRKLEKLRRGEDPNKRRKASLDTERGIKSVEDDYWGDNPTFSSLEFEAMFGVTREMVRRLVEAWCEHEPKFFSREGHLDAAKKRGHPSHCKILAVLKIC